MQADVSCEFGFERRGNECSEMPNINADQCPLLKQGKYKMSTTSKRLVQGDICRNVERVIPDTNGKGSLPNSKGGSRHWAAWIFGTLVNLFSHYALPIGGNV